MSTQKHLRTKQILSHLSITFLAGTTSNQTSPMDSADTDVSTLPKSLTTTTSTDHGNLSVNQRFSEMKISTIPIQPTKTMIGQLNKTPEEHQQSQIQPPAKTHAIRHQNKFTEKLKKLSSKPKARKNLIPTFFSMSKKKAHKVNQEQYVPQPIDNNHHLQYIPTPINPPPLPPKINNFRRRQELIKTMRFHYRRYHEIKENLNREQNFRRDNARFKTISLKTLSIKSKQSQHHRRQGTPSRVKTI